MPTNGFSNANAIACAALNPTSNAIAKPGPCVAAKASNSAAVTFASRNAACATGIRFFKCSRAASSGTTPPYSACSLICEETVLDNTTPSRTTAALVSSQEVSSASKVKGLQAAECCRVIAYPVCVRRTIYPTIGNHGNVQTQRNWHTHLTATFCGWAASSMVS